MQVLTRGHEPQFGEGVVMGLKMGSLSSTMVTSYRLPIVTTHLSLTVFAAFQLVMERRMDREMELV